MGIRDWLAIIVIVFIVLILLDGFRRKWLERKNRIRVKLDKNIPAVATEDDNDVIVKTELPNGGARIKTRSGEEVPVLVDSVDIDDEDIEEYTSAIGESDETDDFGDFEDSDDMDQEWVDEVQDEEDVEDDADGTEGWDEELDEEPAQTASLDTDESDDNDEILDDDSIEQEDPWNDVDSDELTTKPAGQDTGSSVKQRKQGSEERIEPTFGDADMTFGRDDQGELNLEEHDLFEHEDSDDSAGAADSDEQAQAEEVIVINVMARPGMIIEGRRMLPILMKHGMRLGDMSIFHRHADNTGKGPVMFSMANMLRPGTFSISEMETFTTPGVSFFMQLPNKVGNMQCFEQMLNTAQAVKEELDASLKDENRSVLTQQTIEHSRQRIRDFELEMLARK